MSSALIGHESWRYNRNVIPAKSVSNVCCALFGPSDPVNTTRLFEDTMQADRNRVARCLDFDCVAEKPISKIHSQQRYEWSKVPSNTLPKFYSRQTPKLSPTKETKADSILREKVNRSMQYKVLRLIQESPNKSRPSIAPILPNQMTPVKSSVLRPLPMHALRMKTESPVLKNPELANLPTVTTPPGDGENNITVKQTPLRTPNKRSLRSKTMTSRTSSSSDLKQPKITDMMPKVKARATLLNRFSEQNVPMSSCRKRTRRSISIDSPKKQRVANGRSNSQ